MLLVDDDLYDDEFDFYDSVVVDVVVGGGGASAGGAASPSPSKNKKTHFQHTYSFGLLDSTKNWRPLSNPPPLLRTNESRLNLKRNRKKVRRKSIIANKTAFGGRSATPPNKSKKSPPALEAADNDDC
jgi:hypothetical protein